MKTTLLNKIEKGDYIAKGMMGTIYLAKIMKEINMRIKLVRYTLISAV